MNIYVGNLNYAASDEDLESLFQQYGTVDSAKIIFDRASQRSKGFGFVEMPDDGEAQEAMTSLNGSEFMGRPLKVNQAREKKRRF
jgi:RNA recognition motif-containing protein